LKLLIDADDIGHFLEKRNLYFIFSASPSPLFKNVPVPLKTFVFL